MKKFINKIDLEFYLLMAGIVIFCIIVAIIISPKLLYHWLKGDLKTQDTNGITGWGSAW